MTAFAPMPRASVSTAVMVNHGALRICRSAKRTSCRKLSTGGSVVAVSISLTCLLSAAQPKYSLPMRFLFVQASAHRIVSIHGDMAFQLSIKFNSFFANEHSSQSQQ